MKFEYRGEEELHDDVIIAMLPVLFNKYGDRMEDNVSGANIYANEVIRQRRIACEEE